MFQNVPMTFLYFPPILFKDSCKQIYIPIRSVQLFHWNAKVVYVPIHSDYVRIRSHILEDFTKSVTFLYVLCKCRKVRPPCTFLLRSLVHFRRSYFAATLLPPSFTLATIGRLVLKRNLLLRSYTFLIRSFGFREDLSLWDLLAFAAPGLDSGFWGTSHKTLTRLNQIADFRWLRVKAATGPGSGSWGAFRETWPRLGQTFDSRWVLFLTLIRYGCGAHQCNAVCLM